MAERKEEERKHVNSRDGSEKVRPEDEKDFAGIDRAKRTKDVPPTEVTKEWEAREDERPTP